MDPKPKYIVDIVNSSNEVAMGLLLQKGLDLSNNFLPGAANLVNGKFGISTYYPDPPYMLSANTAWLVPNTTKKPLDDAGVPSGARVRRRHQRRSSRASTATWSRPPARPACCRQWDAVHRQGRRRSDGFAYDKAKAGKLLADAGYKDSDGDGFVENKDGSKINLSLIVPSGWTDWMEAIRVIAASAKDGRDQRHPRHSPTTTRWWTKRSAGRFDLVINNDQQLEQHALDVLQLHLPAADPEGAEHASNFGRYENKEAWDLVQELDQRRSPTTSRA